MKNHMAKNMEHFFHARLLHVFIEGFGSCDPQNEGFRL